MPNGAVLLSRCVICTHVTVIVEETMNLRTCVYVCVLVRELRGRCSYSVIHT